LSFSSWGELYFVFMMKYIVQAVHIVRRVYWYLTRPETKGVRVIIQNAKGEFLLVKHVYDPYYYLPGGGIKKHETPERAALREIREEVGIELDFQPLKFFGIYTNNQEYKKDTIYVFSVCIDAIPEKHSFEIEHHTFVTENDMYKPEISLATKNRLLEYLAKRPKNPEWAQGANVHEYYEGSEENMSFVKKYLSVIRSVRPVEICINARSCSIKELLVDSQNVLGVDAVFLKQCLEFLENEIKKHSSQLTCFDLDRFYVSQVLNEEDVGGFHAEISLGYQYYVDAAYVCILNSFKINNKRLIVYELMRSLAHDTIHRSTFRTFRRNIKRATNQTEAKHSMPSIYRYQYGINFRNKKGVAFSSAGMTHEVPKKINLNLLMDGVTVIKAADMVLAMIKEFGMGDLDDFEESVLSEILLQGHQSDILPERVRKFNIDVVTPTKLFIEYWGGEAVMNLLFDAMLSGNLVRAKKYFAEKTGNSHFWEETFMQPAFTYDEAE
jgi:8-oxo-dGTP pyrophosphatase MutT (NUDIX family)